MPTGYEMLRDEVSREWLSTFKKETTKKRRREDEEEEERASQTGRPVLPDQAKKFAVKKKVSTADENLANRLVAFFHLLKT